jgi:TatD DNase family protein
MFYYDAHCHLQDKRLKPFLAEIVEAIPQSPIKFVSVCGSEEKDWKDVAELSEKYNWIIPSFGVHPWYVKDISQNWFESLSRYLDEHKAGVGEIGLDTWIKGYDIELQESVFVSQLKIAAERNIPASIHCVKAWDILIKILKTTPLPSCGFIIHSYGGLKNYIKPLYELGAYFSFPGYYANDRKIEQRESFKQIPIERLLIETDAPDQLPPDFLNKHPLFNTNNKRPLNHPLNLIPIYEFAAQLLGVSKLCEIVEENFLRLFSGIMNCRK